VFGLRYHVASLAAVFVALAVGILLGVAISGRVTDAGEGLEEELLRGENQQLEQDLDAARAAADSAARRGEASEELIARAYPTLMDNRLEGENVAVLFLGPADGALRAEVEGALADADAGAPAKVVAMDVPVDADDLQSSLEGDELLASYANEDGDFSDLGRELGRELVEGGDTPLWEALSTQLVEERSGTTSLPMDSVVVVATWMPDEPSDGEDEEADPSTSSLMEGLVRGADGTGVPVVGVAASDEPPEVVDFYLDQGVSAVDDIDTQPGRLALALLLAGAEPGHYGVSEDADGVIPPIEPLTVEGD
jgi:Copper transport outer membrane protein, MctB